MVADSTTFADTSEVRPSPRPHSEFEQLLAEVAAGEQAAEALGRPFQAVEHIELLTQASVLEPFLGESEFGNHGQRVVEGQRLMQATSDIMLGWIRTTGLDGAKRDYYVRQLWDAKGSALVEAMKPSAMEMYAQVCGWTLARAHARSGDAIAIASYLGSGDAFDRALASFAECYADQNERDYAALQDAVATGRVAAETGL